MVFSSRIFKIYSKNDTSRVDYKLTCIKLNFEVKPFLLVNFCYNPLQPQNEYVEQSRKRRGYRLDHFEKK